MAMTTGDRTISGDDLDLVLERRQGGVSMERTWDAVSDDRADCTLRGDTGGAFAGQSQNGAGPYISFTGHPAIQRSLQEDPENRLHSRYLMLLSMLRAVLTSRRSAAGSGQTRRRTSSAISQRVVTVSLSSPRISFDHVTCRSQDLQCVRSLLTAGHVVSAGRRGG